MKPRAVVVAACTVLLAAGCSSATRHSVLSFFFDGVPEKKAAGADQRPKAMNSPATLPEGVTKHSPYASKQCDACHVPAATNALLFKDDRLCLNCHDIKLDKAVVHAAIGAGGCTGCHDPHASRFPHLLSAKVDDVCFNCHDTASVEKVESHGGRPTDCTNCHDPHASDQKSLLK